MHFAISTRRGNLRRNHGRLPAYHLTISGNLNGRINGELLAMAHLRTLTSGFWQFPDLVGTNGFLNRPYDVHIVNRMLTASSQDLTKKSAAGDPFGGSQWEFAGTGEGTLKSSFDLKYAKLDLTGGWFGSDDGSYDNESVAAGGKRSQSLRVWRAKLISNIAQPAPIATPNSALILVALVENDQVQAVMILLYN